MRFFSSLLGVVVMLLCMAAALPANGNTQSDKSTLVAVSAAGTAEASSKPNVPTNSTIQSSKHDDDYTQGIWGCAKRGWSDLCEHWGSDDIHTCHSTAFDRDQTYGFESWNPDPGMACVMYANGDCTGKIWGEGYWGFWAHDTDKQTLQYPYFKSLSFRCAPCANPNPGCDWPY